MANNTKDNWATDGGFHVSVDGNGRVSLWDTEELAQNVQGEVYVFLPVTLDQAKALARAAHAARE